MNVFSTFELIFLTQLNYYSYILSLLPMLSISIPLSYELAFEVVCKKTKLRTRALWMKSNNCKLFGCVNIASFISVKRELQADFVSVDITMSSINVEGVKQLQALQVQTLKVQAMHGRSYDHMGKISP
jgi:hypothetical protein